MSGPDFLDLSEFFAIEVKYSDLWKEVTGEHKHKNATKTYVRAILQRFCEWLGNKPDPTNWSKNCILQHKERFFETFGEPLFP